MLGEESFKFLMWDGWNGYKLCSGHIGNNIQTFFKNKIQSGNILYDTEYEFTFWSNFSVLKSKNWNPSQNSD